MLWDGLRYHMGWVGFGVPTGATLVLTPRLRSIDLSAACLYDGHGIWRLELGCSDNAGVWHLPLLLLLSISFAMFKPCTFCPEAFFSILLRMTSRAHRDSFTR